MANTRTCTECGTEGLSWRLAYHEGETLTRLCDADTGAVHVCPKTGKVPTVYGRAGRRAKGRPWVPAAAPVAPALAPTQGPAPWIPPAAADPAPAAPSPASPGGSVEAAIQALIGGALNARMDKVEADLLAMVAELETKQVAAKPAPVEHVVVYRNAAGDETKVPGTHAQFADLLQLVQPIPVLGRIPVLLYGKPGASKSHSGKVLAETLGLSFWSISLTPQTPESRLFGLMPLPGQEYKRTGFHDAVEHGGVVLIDELDFGPPSLLGSLNSLLANGFASFPTGVVRVHPDFVLIATANTPGRGGAIGHESRRPLDAATLDRFAVLEWRYDEDQEEQIAGRINPDASAAWEQWVRKVREHARDAQPGLTVSPRTTYYGAGLLGHGFGVDAVADMVLFRGLDASSRAKVLSACPLPKVRK